LWSVSVSVKERTSVCECVGFEMNVSHSRSLALPLSPSLSCSLPRSLPPFLPLPLPPFLPLPPHPEPQPLGCASPALLQAASPSGAVNRRAHRVSPRRNGRLCAAKSKPFNRALHRLYWERSGKRLTSPGARGGHVDGAGGREEGTRGDATLARDEQDCDDVHDDGVVLRRRL